jgi:hypothetical protein
MSEPDLECGKLGPALQSGGKPPHSKDQGKRTLVQLLKRGPNQRITDNA